MQSTEGQSDSSVAWP
nr:unnamed protein product [Callosobruchus chinensis]